jgi:FkbM family methyltransferase
VVDADFTFSSRFLLAAANAAGVPRDALAKRVRGVFFRLAERLDPTVTLEIGAFEAGFSRWAREQFPSARVLAYEANPYVFDRFRDEVQPLGVEYVNACVGPANGTVSLNVPTDFRGGPRDLVNQMASLNTNLNTETHHVVEVPGVRLDDVVKATDDDRIVAWIDVEGALGMVLEGSRETLSRASVAYVEVENIPIWDGQWLDTDVVAWFGEIGMVPILRDIQRAEQYNLLFISEELARDPAVAKLAARVYAPVAAAGTDEAVPPRVPASRLGRVQGLLQRTLKAQNEKLRDQNRRLRKQVRRQSRQVRSLERRLASLDDE